MENKNVEEKVIKDLEFMAKRLKKRIDMLDEAGMMSSIGDTSNSIVLLSSEYRSIKHEILNIYNTIPEEVEDTSGKKYTGHTK